MPRTSKKTVKVPVKKNIKHRAAAKKSIKQKIVSAFPSKIKYDEVKSLKLWLILVGFLLVLGLILSNLYWSQNLKAFSAPCLLNESAISANNSVPNKINLTETVSASCLDLGGKLKMAMRGDNLRYRICVLPNNNECDNQALFEGNCPIDGVTVPAGVNSSVHYCLINGGTFDEVNNTCNFVSGNNCGVDDYYNGNCVR